MTASLVIPPAAILILGGLVLPLLHERLRALAILVLPLVTLYLVWRVFLHGGGAEIVISRL